MEETFGEIVSISLGVFLFVFKKVQQWEYTYISDTFRCSNLGFHDGTVCTAIILTWSLLELPDGNSCLDRDVYWLYMSWPNSLLSVCLLWWKNQVGAIKNLLHIKNLNSSFKELLKCETYYLMCVGILQTCRYVEGSLEDMKSRLSPSKIEHWMI